MLAFVSKIIENRFAKTSLILVFIQGLTLIVSFFGNVLLAGIYKNPEGFGEFNFYFSIITTLGYSVTFGLDTLILKKNTEFALIENRSGIAEIVSKSLRITLFFAFVSAFLVLFMRTNGLRNMDYNNLFMGLGIVFSGLLVIRSFTLRSFGELLYSNLFNNSLKTMFFYFFVVVICVLPFNFTFNIGVGSFVFATIACWICIEFLLLRLGTNFMEASDTLTYRHLLVLGTPFFLYDLIGNFALNIDVFLIEFVGNEYFLGQYSFYKKLSLIPFMAISIVGAVLQTKYLEVFQMGNRSDLQQMVFKTNRWMFFFALISCFLLMLAFNILSKRGDFFGNYFKQYYGFEHILYILGVSEIICSAFGPNNYFMLMLGLEKVAILLDLLFVGFLVCIGLWFNYLFGFEGFVWAYATARLFKNLLVWIFIKDKSKISFFIL